MGHGGALVEALDAGDLLAQPEHRPQAAEVVPERLRDTVRAAPAA